MHGILDQPGSYNSGTLGSVAQPGAVRSGSLGNAQPGSYRSGSLGFLQPGSYRSGSLGVVQPGAYQSGSLGCGCGPKAQAGLGTTTRLLPFRSISGLGALPVSLDLAVGFAVVFGGLYFFEKKMGGG